MKQPLFLLAGSIILLAFSCAKDDNPVVAAGNFLGTYDVTEICDGINDSYEITITAIGTDGNSVQIYNLWSWYEYATATVSGNNITIPNQVLDEVTFSGSGTISGRTLTINYTVIDDGDMENCSAVCVRR